jgi:cytochrome c oxidase subunit I
MGFAGVPRRYYAFTAFDFSSGFANLNIFITTAAILGAAGQLIFLANFFLSIFFGKKATENPWDANTLEWTTAVNPGHGNWDGPIPEVHRWPYDYSRPGVEADFLPQHIAPSDVVYEAGYVPSANEHVPH